MSKTKSKPKSKPKSGRRPKPPSCGVVGREFRPYGDVGSLMADGRAVSVPVRLIAGSPAVEFARLKPVAPSKLPKYRAGLAKATKVSQQIAVSGQPVLVPSTRRKTESKKHARPGRRTRR